MTGSHPHGPRHPLSERMAAAARDLQDQRDATATYRMATRLAVTNVDGCDAAGLTIVGPRRRIETHGATSEAVHRCDELQRELDEGPCLDAVRTTFETSSPSLGHDDRWPRWGPRVVEETGLHSVLSFRLFSHADVLGALNLYAAPRDAFDEEDHADALAMAAHIAIAVTAAQRQAHLETALGSRTVIGQATGVLMERYGLDPQVAFRLLERVASTEEVKVRVLAAELVETGRLRGVDRRTEAAGA